MTQTQQTAALLKQIGRKQIKKCSIDKSFDTETQQKKKRRLRITMK